VGIPGRKAGNFPAIPAFPAFDRLWGKFFYEGNFTAKITKTAKKGEVKGMKVKGMRVRPNADWGLGKAKSFCGKMMDGIDQSLVIRRHCVLARQASSDTYALKGGTGYSMEPTHVGCYRGKNGALRATPYHRGREGGRRNGLPVFPSSQFFDFRPNFRIIAAINLIAG
jgi:hypothetical protein